jgi:transcriptional regulator with XRE-family HTH domain
MSHDGPAGAPSAVSMYETGHRGGRWETLLAFAALYDVPVAEFLVADSLLSEFRGLEGRVAAVERALQELMG